jgi:hypothetical protein
MVLTVSEFAIDVGTLEYLDHFITLQNRHFFQSILDVIDMCRPFGILACNPPPYGIVPVSSILDMFCKNDKEVRNNYKLLIIGKCMSIQDKRNIIQ